MVCQMEIYTSDEIIACPECGRQAHLSHFLEWMKIKGFCPYCNSNINGKQLKKCRKEAIIAS
jgi:hypothetical protein